MNVLNVLVNGKRPGANYEDNYDLLRVNRFATIHQHHFFQKKVDAVLGKDGKPPEELVITFPKNLKIPVPLDGPLNTLDQGDPSEDFADKLIIRIDFALKSIRDGFAFVGCEGDDLRYPHVYTTGTPYPGSSASLIPTLDTIHDRWTWDIDLTFPKTVGDVLKALKRQSSVGGSEKSLTPNEDDDLDMTAVCSGDFITEMDCPTDSNKKTIRFKHSVAVTPQALMFAIGPFTKVGLGEFRDEQQDDKLGTNLVEVIGYALPDREEELKNTCMFLPRAVDFFVMDLGIFPFSKCFKVCFVDDMTADTSPGASLCVCSNELLFPADVIDQIYPVTRAITNGLAAQWLGVNIVPLDWADLWLIIGLARLKTGSFMRKLFGNNEFRYRLKKDAEQICELDIGRPPLYAQGLQIPLEPMELEFIELKAPVVLSILERRLSKASGSKVLDRAVAKLIMNAKTGDLPNFALSTSIFIRLCEKLAHTKLEAFFNQWVFGSGYPRFEVGQRFNKKKMLVEMNIRQVQMNETPKHKVTGESFFRDVRMHEMGLDVDEIQPCFTGPMTIRIHEADGTPYEHVVEIKEMAQKLEIPYNTKYKRLKRSRRQKERAAAAAGIEMDNQNEDVLLYCLGDVLQTEDDVAQWQLDEWTKEEEDRMSQESFEWIRLDADFEWICMVTVNQPDYMFLSQLQQDRDVIAQYEAIQYFKSIRETRLVSTILLRTLMDRRYYYGIRIEAAYGLARCATKELEYIGAFHLTKAFQYFFCNGESGIPRGNDFQNFMQYYVQKAIPSAISNVRNDSGSTPLRVQRFLLDLLKYNDNANNAYTDAFYIADLIRALGNTLVSNDYATDVYNLDYDPDEVEELRGQILEEIERHQRLDAWLPGYHNIVTQAALQAKMKLVRAGTLKKNLKELLIYSKEGTNELLRLCAFQALLDDDGLHNPHLVKYLLGVIGKDPANYMRYHILRLLVKAIGSAAVTVKEDANGLMDQDEMIIETENDNRMNARQAELARETVRGAWDNLRKELGEMAELQKGLWTAVQSKRLGILDVRLMLRICQILYVTRDSLVITLQAKKHRKCEHLGKGKVRIYMAATPFPTGKSKPKPLPPPPPPAPAPATPAIISKPAPIPQTPATPSAPPEKPKILLKLNYKQKDGTPKANGKETPKLSTPKLTTPHPKIHLGGQPKQQTPKPLLQTPKPPLKPQPSHTPLGTTPKPPPTNGHGSWKEQSVNRDSSPDIPLAALSQVPAPTKKRKAKEGDTPKVSIKKQKMPIKSEDRPAPKEPAPAPKPPHRELKIKLKLPKQSLASVRTDRAPGSSTDGAPPPSAG